MSESKAKSRRRSEILAGEERCIYCIESPETVEHMPPVSMFHERSRLSGFEFAACKACNSDTRAADTAAAFLSRISPTVELNEIELREAKKLFLTMDQIAPGFRHEVLVGSNPTPTWTKGRSEIFGRMQRLELNGYITQKLMHVFGAKLGMALFREEVGRPLGKSGAVFTQHFFNAGLDRVTMEASLRIMPVLGQLKMGKRNSGRSFNYRFNCDKRSIFAGLVAFHDNLFFRIFASDDASYLKALDDPLLHMRVDVGELQSIARTWMPTHTLDPTHSLR